MQSQGRRVHADRMALLVRAWSDEIAQARDARSRSDPIGEWHHLERAHILSQPLAVPHVRTHLSMLGAGFRRRDVREVTGQLLRLALAAPGSVSGRYPVGNTGRANVSAFVPLPVTEDLRRVLHEPEEAIR